eukprot:5201905-Pleurochrysis_carterae.AAC.1
MHKQLDGCLAALQALGDNPARSRRTRQHGADILWVPLTELLGVARWRKNPTAPDAILQEARLLCK